MDFVHVVRKMPSNLEIPLSLPNYKTKITKFIYNITHINCKKMFAENLMFRRKNSSVSMIFDVIRWSL